MAENTSFAAFVKESRERKKTEALAQAILGSRGRNANGAGSVSNKGNNGAKPSLLSRVSNGAGVAKSRSSSAKPSPNIEGKWTHDLHKLNNPHGPPNKKLNRTASASQIDRNTRSFDKFRSVLQQNNAPATESTGFNIRGVANSGPFTVIASNFAPGTTAADIEMFMAPNAQQAGAEIVSCRLISSNPTIMVELVINKKEGADNVIATFNNQKADGRQMYVYLKETSNIAPAPSRPATRPTGRLGPSSYDDMDIDMEESGRGRSFQDGRYGFSDRINDSDRRGPPRGPPTGPSGPRRRY